MQCPRHARTKTRLFLQKATFCVVAVVTMSGCATESSIYEEIQTRRGVAYQEWERAQAQEEKAQPFLEGDLSLEDALKVALSHNKSLLAALQEQEIAQGVVLESYSEALPKLAATADYVRLDRVGSFNVGGKSVSIGDANNYSVALKVTQPIFRGGAIPAALRAARLASLLATEQVRDAVQQVIFEVAKAYYDTLLAEHLYTVNRDAVLSSEAHLKDVKVKQSQGIASNFDVLRAQVDVSLFEAEMIQQRNRIHLNQAQLMKTLGASQASDIVLSDSLEYFPMKPVMEEAVRIAYQNRPDLYQAELGIGLQEQALRVARSKYWPEVNAWAVQEWTRPDPHTSEIQWGNARSGGISASWPLFDGLKREGLVVQERARLKKREIELVDAEERTLLEIQQAILSVRDSEEFVDSQRLNLQRAKEALRLAEVDYREGIAEAVQVTEARSALTNAQGLYYEAVHAHSVARLALERAMGILGPRAGEPPPVEGDETTAGKIEEFTIDESQRETTAGKEQE